MTDPFAEYDVPEVRPSRSDRERRGRDARAAAVRSGKRAGEVPHGTSGGYTNWRCRCPECRTANTEAVQRWRREKRLALRANDVSVTHGVDSTYTNYGCRCDVCREAHRVTEERRRARAGSRGG